MTQVVYLFHGDDEVAMRSELEAMRAKLGDPATAEMNTARYDAPPSLNELSNVVQAMPFLAEYRLVSVSGISKSNMDKASVTAFLEQVPPHTRLVLLEPPLSDKKSKNWLLKWAEGAGETVLVREFALPQGGQMAAWLRERAKQLGGELQPQAAAALAQLIGSDKQAGDNELEKLLAYAAYARPIEEADVRKLSIVLVDQGDFFKLLDAVFSGKPGAAMDQLEELFEQEDLILLFFSLVSQFRLLVQARSLVDQAANADTVSAKLKVSSGRAYHLVRQSKSFPPGQLDAIYKRLLELDELVKSGEMEAELAMEAFVASLSAQAA